MIRERTAVFSLTGPVDGATIACDSGTLWITQAGDIRDHVVRPGTTFAVSGEGCVTVQLFGNAGVTVRLPDSHPGRLLRLLRRCGLANGLRGLPLQSGFGLPGSPEEVPRNGGKRRRY